MANIFNNIQAGFRFKPTDDELITHYLLKKVLNQPLPPNKITELNISNYTPMQLRDFPNYGEKEMYFFSSRDRKYPKGKRPDRKATDNGFWKASGKDKPVYASNGVHIGLKKALVFYFKIDKKQVKTNWIMQEYRVGDAEHKRTGADDMKLDDCVLCKIYQTDRKSSGKRSGDEDDGTQTNDFAVQSCETGEMIHGNEDGLKQENDHIPESGLKGNVIIYPPMLNYDHCNYVQRNHHNSGFISQTEDHGLNDQRLQEEKEFDPLEFLILDHDDLL